MTNFDEQVVELAERYAAALETIERLSEARENNKVGKGKAENKI